MPYPLLKATLLTSCLVLGITTISVGQAGESRNLATDTLQPANPKFYHPISRLGTAKGQTLHIFITSVSDRGTGIEFTYRNPQTLPRPKPVFISSEQLQWVVLEGGYFEPVRLAGEKAHSLARRLATGPRTELFDIATPKKGVPIPLPMPGGGATLLWTGMFSDKYNHAYYLRRPGEKLMVKVPDGKKGVPFIANYFADTPALAASISQNTGSEGYKYDDVPALVSRYNELID